MDLGSAELTAICTQPGRFPTPAQGLSIAAAMFDRFADELNHDLNSDQLKGCAVGNQVVNADEGAKMPTRH